MLHKIIDFFLFSTLLQCTSASNNNHTICLIPAFYFIFTEKVLFEIVYNAALESVESERKVNRIIEYFNANKKVNR